MAGCDVAADRAALGGVGGIGWNERYDEHLTSDFGHHQPVRRRYRWIEERIGLPHLVDVVDAKPRVFEQVGGLVVDLEGVLVVKEIEVEPVSHPADRITTAYVRPAPESDHSRAASPGDSIMNTMSTRTTSPRRPRSARHETRRRRDRPRTRCPRSSHPHHVALARYYDPATGRFTATDQLADLSKPKSLDAYGYGHGNPTTLTDPTGLCATNNATAGACYAKRYADQQRGQRRFVALMWSSWYSKLTDARHYVESYRDRPNTTGYSMYYLGKGGPEAAIEETAERAFIHSVGQSIAGLSDTGNGWFLLPEGRAGWEGPPDRGGARTRMGPVGWRAGLVDDNSPEGHLTGYALLAYVYGRAQTTAGLRTVEWDPNNEAHSQQDYDLGVIGIDAGAKLADSGYSGPQMIRDLDAKTRGSWSSEAPPDRIPMPDSGQPTVLGNLPCYFGLTC